LFRGLQVHKLRRLRAFFVIVWRAIFGQGDPIDDIEQSSEVELYNRSHFKNAVPIMIVPGNTGMYSVRRSDVAANLSSDSAFVKP
jgi:hypothetical protein